MGPDERLVCAAGVQQQRPADVVRRRHAGEQQPGRHVGAFQGPAQDQEPPGVVVAHGRVGQAEEQRRTFPHETEEHVRAEAFGAPALGGQAVRGDVEALPHLAGDHLADAARAGPRGHDRACAGARVLRIIGQAEQGRPDVEPGVRAGLDAEDAKERAAVRAGRAALRRRVAEHPVHVDIDQPRGVIRPLDVAPGPEQVLGQPAEQLVVHWSGPLWRLTAPRAGRSGGLRSCGLASSGRAAG